MEHEDLGRYRCWQCGRLDRADDPEDDPEYWEDDDEENGELPLYDPRFDEIYPTEVDFEDDNEIPEWIEFAPIRKKKRA